MSSTPVGVVYSPEKCDLGYQADDHEVLMVEILVRSRLQVERRSFSDLDIRPFSKFRVRRRWSGDEEIANESCLRIVPA